MQMYIYAEDYAGIKPTVSIKPNVACISKTCLLVNKVLRNAQAKIVGTFAHELSSDVPRPVLVLNHNRLVGAKRCTKTQDISN